MRELTEQNLIDIAMGACLRASGGGGPISMVEPLLGLLKGKTVRLVEPREVPDDEWVAASAGAGSPADADRAKTTVPELAKSAVTAFKLLQDHVEHVKEKKLTHTVAAETGIANTLIPLVVAAELGIPVIDGSGARRAVPSLTMCAFAEEPISPVEIVSTEGRNVSINVKKTKDAEQPMMAIVSTEDFAHMGALAFWPMSAKTAQKRIIPKAVSEVQTLGEALRNAQKGDEVEAVCAALEGTELFRGELRHHKDQTTGSFDFLRVTLESQDKTTLTIYAQNESMIAWRSDVSHPVAMGPDLICYLAKDGERWEKIALPGAKPLSLGAEPFSNADLEHYKEKEIVVIAAPCSDELCSPYIMSSFTEALRPLGYGGNYLPFEGRAPFPLSAAEGAKRPRAQAQGFQPAQKWWSRRLRPDS